MSRSSEGRSHSAACLWKGLDLSNNVCEYEVNQIFLMTKLFQKSKTLTQNDKVVKEQC